MSLTSRSAAILVAAGLIGLLAACSTETVTSPTPSGMPTVRPSTTPRATAARPPVSPRPSRAPTRDLGDEIEVGVLGAEVAEHIYEFVSDGTAIVFSSGAAPDVTDTDAAPDLWRFVPGASATPELIWRNPERNHVLVKVAGDLGTMAFVDMPLSGERSWRLWLIPRPGDEARLLDEHPGDEAVSSLVPSFSIYERRIVWTAFDRGESGPVSRLLVAEEPAWEPRVLLERPAVEAELWLPSLYGAQVAFTEVRYAPDRSSDERHVYLMNVGDPAVLRRLDRSGRATMPIIVPDAVLWKEAEPGFNMFNWGHMYRFDLVTEEVSRLDTHPQDFVNYPSAGGRFAAWWGADSFAFGVYDLVRDEPRLIERNGPTTDTSVLRPHISSDLLVWLRVVGHGPGSTAELRYAFLPDAAAERGR